MTPSDSSARKRNATRACDTCKRRKVKCDGQNPCSRCSSAHIECSYRLPYNRVQSGIPAYYYHRQSCRCNSQTVEKNHDTSAVSDSALETHVDKSPVRLPQPETADASPQAVDDYTGDASVNGFLQRVSFHLGHIGQALPRNLFKRHEEDDQGRLEGYVQTLVLPEKSLAYSALEAYFDHGNATCRFLPREPIFELLEQLYTNDRRLAQSHTKMAMILLVIGTGFVWNASWKNEPVAAWRARAVPFLQVATERLRNVDRIYPPTTEVLQAQLLRCQCELVLGRFNSAWMSLGWAIRQSQMLDIQKEQRTSKLDPLEAFYRRRFFWAMFMIDRYLAVILGRPMGIQESETEVPLSAHLEAEVAAQVDATEKKLIMGTTVHYELVKIIGKAATQLYPVKNRDQDSTDFLVSCLEGELEQWLQNTPRFFHPEIESLPRDEEQYYNVPWILKRQQRTIRGAFFFTKMLIYRSYLLQDFHCQEPNQPLSSSLSPRALLCTDNALAMVELSGEFGVHEGKYNGTFWITSHFVFSAISILLVYLTLCQDPDRRATIETAVEDAMAFHRKLDNSVNISAQRLLEESRSRARIVQSIRTPASSAAGVVSQPGSDHTVSQPVQPATCTGEPWLAESSNATVPWPPHDSDGAVLETPSSMDQPHVFGTGPLASSYGFDMIMDIGFDNSWCPETDPNCF